MKLTHEEHAARAMLMGRIYDWVDGTYCTYDNNGLDTDAMICCMDLEPISWERSVARRLAGGDEYHFTLPPIKETPWARMDDE
jgi:hypothetical protein